jgi:hypothetical protein
MVAEGQEACATALGQGCSRACFQSYRSAGREKHTHFAPCSACSGSTKLTCISNDSTAKNCVASVTRAGCHVIQ